MKIPKVFATLAIFTVFFAVITVAAYIDGENLPTGNYIVTQLSTKPDQYFVVTNPDPLLLQAINNPDEPVFLYHYEKPQIFDMIEQHGTNNIENQNKYYTVCTGLCIDYGGFFELFLPALLGFIISAILLVGYSIFKGVSHFMRRAGFRFKIIHTPRLQI